MGLFAASLSSAGTTIASNLSWVGGKNTSVAVTIGSSASSGDFIVQMTLDDLQRSSSPLWIGLSSESLFAPGSAPALHYAASAIFPDGVRIFIPGPVGGIRLNSTSLTGTLTLRCQQGEGG